jgi:hypothetical protein
LLGAILLPSLALTVMALLPLGAPVEVFTVNVALTAELPLTTNGDGLNAHVGAGASPVMLLHDKLTLPV